MVAVSCSQKTAAFLAGIYGVVAIAGGTIGFLAGSTASIVAGGISGVLLLLSAWAALYYKPSWGLIAAAVLSLALIIRFVMVVVQSLNAGKELTPTGPVMIGGGVIVLLASVYALIKKGAGTCRSA